MTNQPNEIWLSWEDSAGYGYWDTRDEAELNSAEDFHPVRFVPAASEAETRIAALEAARIAYASEFPPNADGEPDVGSIHANIRALKTKVAASEAVDSKLVPVEPDEAMIREGNKVTWPFPCAQAYKAMIDAAPTIRNPLMVASEAGAVPVYYRYRHSANEKWHYGPTPQSWWECKALYAAPPAQPETQAGLREIIEVFDPDKHNETTYPYSAAQPAPSQQAAPAAEPVPNGMRHVCNLWVDPSTRNYVIDRCDHPPAECIPAYIKVAPAVESAEPVDWETGAIRRHEDMLAEAAKYVEQKTAATADAPGHTDLMVSPESLDEYMEANPLDEPTADAQGDEQVSPEAHLLAEAHKYWTLANAKHYGAVQWIESEETGELLIFTRGEYRETLMRNIAITAEPASQGVGDAGKDAAWELAEKVRADLDSQSWHERTRIPYPAYTRGWQDCLSMHIAPATQGGGDAVDAARLDALESTAGEDKWIVAKNKDSFTVYLRPRHHATRKTLREAIDAARAQRAEGDK